MLAKLEQLANRLTEIDELLMQPDVASDQDNYRKLSKEHAELGPVVALYNDYVQVQADVDAAQEMLADPEMKEFAQEEISAAEGKMTAIEDDLQLMLLPKDPNDDKNIFLEIRAGTGGDESALFAADLLRMYSRFAEKNRWKVEIVSASESELGGYREVIGPSDRQRRLFQTEIRIRRPSGATCSCDGNAGTYPYVGLYGCRDARSGRCQRRAYQSGGYPDRHFPRFRCRWPAYQQDGFGDPDYPFPDWDRGRVSG